MSTVEVSEALLSKRKFRKMRVWATWRGGKWPPCIWSRRRCDAVENRDPDEVVIQVLVSPIKQRRADRPVRTRR